MLLSGYHFPGTLHLRQIHSTVFKVCTCRSTDMPYEVTRKGKWTSSIPMTRQALGKWSLTRNKEWSFHISLPFHKWGSSSKSIRNVWNSFRIFFKTQLYQEITMWRLWDTGDRGRKAQEKRDEFLLISVYADAGKLSLVFLDTNGGALIYDIISEDCIRGGWWTSIKGVNWILRGKTSLFGKGFPPCFWLGHSLQKALVKYRVKVIIIHVSYLND